MPLQNGDFILIDYVGKVKETGEVFDTTIEEIEKRRDSTRKEKYTSRNLSF